MLGQVLAGPMQAPQPTQQQPNALGDVLMPNAPAGQPALAQNYNSWQTVLKNPAMAAALAQFATSIARPTGNGTASDLVGAVTGGLAAGGRAAAAADAEAKAKAKEATAAEQATFDREQDTQRLELERQRVEIARQNAERVGRGGGGGGGRSASAGTDFKPTEIAKMEWQQAQKEWMAANKAWMEWDELTQGPRPEGPGPAPELGAFLYRAQTEEAAFANGLDRGLYYAPGLPSEAKKALIEAWARGKEVGMAFEDSLLASPDLDVVPPVATTPAPTITPPAAVAPTTEPAPAANPKAAPTNPPVRVTPRGNGRSPSTYNQ